MKRFWIVLLLLGVFSACGVIVLWFGLHRLESNLAYLSGDTLHWVVDGDYPELRDRSPLAGLRGIEPTQREVVNALAHAADDRHIDGLFLEIRSLPASLAALQELAAGVEAFRAAGKPVTAWLETGGNREYLLACAADEIVLAPEGHVLVTGLSAELTFLAGTLDKLGMEADYVSVGRYKSAPESYLREDPSGPHREMIDAILDDEYDWLTATVAAARGMTVDSVRALVDQGLFDADAALAAGLVDDLDYADDLLDAVFPEADTVDLDDYALAHGTGEHGAQVAVVDVVGTIMGGRSSGGGLFGPSAGSDTVVERLRDAAEDDDVDAILLRVDSPGGSALASDLIWNEVCWAREAKPVIVSMGGVAASGGYYVSCGADSIFASAGTLTGSIGVFTGKMDREGFYGKLGVSRTFLTRGRNALIYGDAATFTPDQRRLIAGQLDAFYDRFVEKVADGRGLSTERTRAAAQGRVWSGERAVELGLVDDIGGLERALLSVRRSLDLADDAELRLVGDARRPPLLARLLALGMAEAGLDASPGADAGLLAAFPPAVLLDGDDAAGTAALLGQARLLDGAPLALYPVRVQFR